MSGVDHLTFVTWLAPSLPLALFERIGRTVAAELGCSVRVLSETKLSGPVLGEPEPFAAGEAALGFICAPACVALAGEPGGSVEPLGLAPLFDDPRHEDWPRCFCDLVVRRDDPAASLAELEGRRFGVNDPASLSGWLGVRDALGEVGVEPEAFFGAVVRTGSHLASLAALREGAIDVASIDSNALLLAQARGEALQGMRVSCSVGPWPAQPVVVHRDLAAPLKAALHHALSRCGPWPDYAFVGFRPQARADLWCVPGLSSRSAEGALQSVEASSPDPL